VVRKAASKISFQGRSRLGGPQPMTTGKAESDVFVKRIKRLPSPEAWFDQCVHRQEHSAI
jgi:hypothetical protein